MPADRKPRGGGQRAAVLVLVVALTATGFGVWRERELARRGQVIRLQDNLTQLQPVLTEWLSLRFEALRGMAKTTLRRANYSAVAWDDFLAAAEWRQRFPGMLEIGYATFASNRCEVKFLASRQPDPRHAPGYNLLADPALRESLQKCADLGYGQASPPTTLGSGSNAVRVIMGWLPLPARDVRPGLAAENRANLQGFVFFALNQPEYFQFCQSQWKAMPLKLRRLTEDEAAPPRTTSQRTFGQSGVAGDWRLVGTLRDSTKDGLAPQWIVLAGGVALSLLMYFLFATQARLRREAEAAHAEVLRRDAEIMGLNRDLEGKITARTAALNAALAEERELNRLKGNFVSMVTHEIRTPLALILGSAEILSRYLERLTPEKRAAHLQTIDSAVQRMSALLEDVLLFSKAEAGRMEFNPAPMELQVFCRQLVDETISATGRRCPIELCVEPVAEPARSDENLLRHVFANLLTNAIKYSPPGTPVQFTVLRTGGDVVFTVADHGVGIPAEDRKRLFTPFARGKNVATIPGTGLGLVIVKHCVERHGGSLEIESTESSGTTVRVRLPLFSPAHTAFLQRLSANPGP